MSIEKYNQVCDGDFSMKHFALEYLNPETTPVDNSNVKLYQDLLDNELEKQKNFSLHSRYRSICGKFAEDVTVEDLEFVKEYKQKFSKEIEFANRLYKSNEKLWMLVVEISGGNRYVRRGNYNAKKNVDLFNKLHKIRPQQFPRYSLIQIFSENITSAMTYSFNTFFDTYLLKVSHEVIRERVMNYIKKNCSDLLSQI